MTMKQPWFGAWPPVPRPVKDTAKGARDLFLMAWDAVDRLRYRPDEYLKRIEDIHRDLSWINVSPWARAYQRHVTEGDAGLKYEQDISAKIEMLCRFTEISLDMWKSLDKQGMLSPMRAYGNELRRLEQHYAKTDCAECGCHAPAHTVGCKNMPKEWR